MSVASKKIQADNRLNSERGLNIILHNGNNLISVSTTMVICIDQVFLTSCKSLAKPSSWLLCIHTTYNKPVLQLEAC